MIPFFSAEDVRAAVSPERALEAVRDAFIAYARGDWTMPPKVYVPAYPAGDFRAMPACAGECQEFHPRLRIAGFDGSESLHHSDSCV